MFAAGSEAYPVASVNVSKVGQTEEIIKIKKDIRKKQTSLLCESSDRQEKKSEPEINSHSFRILDAISD